MHSSSSDPGRRGAVTHNGLRLVGAARDLFSQPTEESPLDLSPGCADSALYGVRLTLRSESNEAVVPAVLDLLRTTIQRTGVELPALGKGRPVSIEPTRTSGVVWRDGVSQRAWRGELLWRAMHPTVRGARVTHHVVLEESPHFDRFTLRITADDGVESVRRAVGAGQVRPAWLDPLAERFRVNAWGTPLRLRTLDELGIEDFVRSTLLGQRSYPVAVLAPRDDGSYVLDPDEVAGELLGVAPLYVIDRHAATFRLSDTVGDKRLSCFFGALRIYMPGFTPSDDPYDHPLLVQDRLVDPVMRATEMGRAAMYVARAIDMPDPFGWTAPAPTDEIELAIDLSGTAAVEVAIEPPVERPPASPHSAGAPALSASEGPPGAAPDAAPGEALGGVPGTAPGDAADSEPSPPSTPSPTPSHTPANVPGTPPVASPAPSSELPIVLELLRGSAEIQDRLVREVARLSDEVARLSDEVDRLRTLTNVRSAGTAMLERQLGRLRDEVEARLPPELTWTVPSERERAAEGAGELADGGELDDLLGVVQAAAEAWPDELLFLPQALAAAAESPYEDADRLGAVLEAMAAVARRRMGGLGVPLREAFREFGVDYRGGISDSTSARLREQYRFVDPESPERTEYECVEHIALGNARDPRYCLRIYFTSRAKAENRFVIGHVGKHFDIGMTN